MIAVGYGNGLFFRRKDGQLPSFDNTFVCDENFANHGIKPVWNNKYFSTDTLTVQVKMGSGETPTLTYYNITDDSSSTIAGALEESYTLYDFWEFDIDFSAFAGDLVYFVFSSSNAADDDWESEPVKVVADDGSYTKIEWYNLDPTTTGATSENFEMDYTTGIVPFMRLQVVLKDYEPEVEVSTYENLDEVVKLREKVKRTLMLKTDEVPRYIVEKLVVATAHDKFYVNEVEFIRKEKPEIENGESNFASFQAVLTQANVIGLNTADVGFDCDEIVGSCKITNLTELNVGADTYFTMPEGYLLQSITLIYNAGTDVLFKFGTVVGQDDVVAMRPTYQDSPITATINSDYADIGDTALFCDVSGTNVDVDVHIVMIQNRDS